MSNAVYSLLPSRSGGDAAPAYREGPDSAPFGFSSTFVSRYINVLPLPYLLLFLVLSMGSGAVLLLALQHFLPHLTSSSLISFSSALYPYASLLFLNSTPVILSPYTNRVPFSNFSVDFLLPPSRWPAFVSSNQPRTAPLVPPSSDPPGLKDDPFKAGSPHRYDGVRGAVISFFTPGQGELQSFFPDNDHFFLSHMSDHSDYIIFWTIYPRDAEKDVHTVVMEQLHCVELTDRDTLTSRNASSSDIYARLRHPQMGFPLRLQGIREFLSPRGTHVITVPIAVHLPRYLQADPAHLMRADWLGCHNIRRNLDYNLFSGSVFSHQLIFHPILRGYDYFIKFDLDIWFHRVITPNPSLFHTMKEQECIWMHSEYNGYGTDCGLEAPEVVEDWAHRRYGMEPASKGTVWWESTDYFYGNLLGGWLGWVHSDENRQLGDFMYEDNTRPAYFTHRWGDQPPYAKMLGMWFRIEDEEVKGEQRTRPDKPSRSKVCDFNDLRDREFEHVN